MSGSRTAPREDDNGAGQGQSSESAEPNRHGGCGRSELRARRSTLPSARYLASPMSLCVPPIKVSGGREKVLLQQRSKLESVGAEDGTGKTVVSLPSATNFGWCGKVTDCCEEIRPPPALHRDGFMVGTQNVKKVKKSTSGGEDKPASGTSHPRDRHANPAQRKRSADSFVSLPSPGTVMPYVPQCAGDVNISREAEGCEDSFAAVVSSVQHSTPRAVDTSPGGGPFGAPERSLCASARPTDVAISPLSLSKREPRPSMVDRSVDYSGSSFHKREGEDSVEGTHERWSREDSQSNVVEAPPLLVREAPCVEEQNAVTSSGICGTYVCSTTPPRLDAEKVNRGEVHASTEEAEPQNRRQTIRSRLTTGGVDLLRITVPQSPFFSPVLSASPDIPETSNDFCRTLGMEGAPVTLSAVSRRLQLTRNSQKTVTPPLASAERIRDTESDPSVEWGSSTSRQLSPCKRRKDVDSTKCRKVRRRDNDHTQRRLRTSIEERQRRLDIPKSLTSSGFNATEVVSGLFLGSYADSKRPEVLAERGISLVLNLATECAVTAEMQNNPHNVHYLKFHVKDRSDEDITRYLIYVAQLIHTQLHRRQCALDRQSAGGGVGCSSGVSGGASHEGVGRGVGGAAGRGDCSRSRRGSTGVGSNAALANHVFSRQDAPPWLSRLWGAGGVLVHCREGVSRSPTIIMGYLILYGEVLSSNACWGGVSDGVFELMRGAESKVPLVPCGGNPEGIDGLRIAKEAAAAATFSDNSEGGRGSGCISPPPAVGVLTRHERDVDDNVNVGGGPSAVAGSSSRRGPRGDGQFTDACVCCCCVGYRGVEVGAGTARSYQWALEMLRQKKENISPNIGFVLALQALAGETMSPH